MIFKVPSSPNFCDEISALRQSTEYQLSLVSTLLIAQLSNSFSFLIKYMLSVKAKSLL